MLNYINTDGSKEIGASTFVLHTVTSAEATAEVVVLTLTDLPSVTHYISQVFRSGVKIADDAAYTTSGDVLTITEEATTPTWVMTAGDVVMLMAGGI